MYVAALLAVTILSMQVARPAQTVTDPRDGKVYPVIEVSGMTWMGRNLDHVMEGTSCPRDDVGACAPEGRLYPWALAVSACPAGWHLTTEDEWQRLERALGMPAEEVLQERHRGEGLGALLKAGGTTGLNFPLAGWRRPDGSFSVGNGNDRAAAIWTRTPSGEDAAWHRDLSSARTGVWRSPVSMTYSLSVRCAKD